MKKLMTVVGMVATQSLFVFVSGCATTGSSVLQRADHLSSTPEWASITNAAWQDKDKQFFLGYVELSADVSKSAALNMADQKAYAAPMESMVNEYFQQNNIAEDLKKSSGISEMIISASRSYRPAMPGLNVTKKYWEVVELKTSKGTEEQLHVYSLAEIPKDEYEAAKKEVLAKLNGDSKLRTILDDVAKKQRDKLTDTTP